MAKRVVITGMGLVTPLGCGVPKVWTSICNGESGIKSISGFESSCLKSRVAGQIDHKELLDYFNDFRKYSKMDCFIRYGIAAAEEAILDSGFLKTATLERCGTLIGSGIGGLSTINNTAVNLCKTGPKRVSPFFIPSSIVNLVSGQVSIRNGLKGPISSVTAACATGANAIADGYRMINMDEADVMVVGGSEAAVCEIGMSGFDAMKALSTKYNDSPESASRPWDSGRDGFVMSDGASVLVLEDYSHAIRRGAKIYAEVLGYGLCSDAYHIAAPDPLGSGAESAMRNALKMSSLNPERIDYINAHSTSTVIGDRIEIQAIKRIFDSKLPPVSSTKSLTGHMLGAAGSAEAIFSILAIKSGILPPTMNLQEIDEQCLGVDFIPNEARHSESVTHVMSNSFGFGGVNIAIVFAAI